MLGKEVIDSKHFYPMLALLCLVIIGLLSWNIWIPLVVVLPVAIFISFLVTLGRHLKLWHGLMREWKAISYATIYAITISMFVFVVFSNFGFIVMNSFYNTLLLIATFLFIIIAVFTYSVIYFKRKLVKAPFIARQIIVDVVFISLIVCLVWGSLFLILAGGGLYDKYVQRTEINMKSLNDDMQEYKLSADEKSLPVFKELGSYYDGAVIKSNNALNNLKTEEQVRPIVVSCLVDDCFKFVAERIVINYDFTVSAAIFKEQMNNARDVVEQIEDNAAYGDTFENTDIKDKAKFFNILNKGITENYFLADVDEFDVLLLKLDNEFNYDEMLEMSDQIQGISVHSTDGAEAIAGLFSAKSLLMKSVSKVLLHTKAAEQLFSTMAIITLNSNKNIKLNPLLKKVYANKDVEEAATSKIVRSYLLYKYTEKMDEGKVNNKFYILL